MGRFQALRAPVFRAHGETGGGTWTSASNHAPRSFGQAAAAAGGDGPLAMVDVGDRCVHQKEVCDVCNPKSRFQADWLNKVARFWLGIMLWLDIPTLKEGGAGASCLDPHVQARTDTVDTRTGERDAKPLPFESKNPFC